MIRNRHLDHFKIAFLLLVFLRISTSKAFATITLEQQINIIDQEYSTAASAVPTDNSLGLIRWDGATYNGETVYFEAILRCDTCSGGSNQATVGLYSSAGSLVTSSNVSTSNSTYTLIRSAAITGNLTNNTDYTARITLDATSGTAYFKSARLIVVQSATTISDSQTQVEIGNASATGNTSYELISSPKLLNYDSSNYTPTPTIYFEASMKSSDPASTAYASLTSASDCSSTVSGSEVTVTGQTWTRVRSSAITLVSGTTYFVCMKSSASQTATMANAKIIFNQTNSLGITDIATYSQFVNTHNSVTGSTYTALDYLNEFNPANYTGARFNFFYESTFNAAGDTGYVKLRNITDSADITGTESTTTDSAYSRIRSGEITSNLPSSTKTLDTEIKNSSASTTHISNSWLVVQMHAYPQLSVELEGVPNSTTTNGITTTKSSQVDSLDFKTLTTGTPAYMAHKFTTSTNAALGYTITMKLTSTLQGNYPANVIDAFPSSWSTPIAWTAPTGTTANVNTGWFGANTSDTRVSGWSSGSSKFGPVGTTAQTIMTSSSTDTGTVAYVTYALEVNQYQPTDVYMGVLVYDIMPNY